MACHSNQLDHVTVLSSANTFVERSFCRMNIVIQTPEYLDQTSSLEELINQVGPEIDMEVDEVGELLQTIQEQLASFIFVSDPINLKQQETIQQALDDCSQARAIQGRLATFIISLRSLKLSGKAYHLSEQANT